MQNFIANEVKDVAVAYLKAQATDYAQRKLSNWMKSRKEKRKASLQEPAYRAVKKMKTGSKPFPTKKLKLKTPFSKRSATSETTVAVKNGKGKVASRSVGKVNVKVSKPLRLKIEKVLEEKKITGTYQCTYYGVLPLPGTNVQGVYPNIIGPLPWSSSFCAKEFIHHASVLFIGRPDGAAAALRDFENPAFPVTIGSTAITGPDVQLPPNNVSSHGNQAKFHVLNSYEVYTYKNNSLRTVEFDIYECTPKSAWMTNNESRGTDNVNTGGQPFRGNPNDTWYVALEEDNKAGGNISNMLQSTLHTSPHWTSSFKKFWKSDVTSVKLEAGQVYQYVVKGPRNMAFDASKYYQRKATGVESLFLSEQKFTKNLMYVIKQDLAAQGSVTCGRYVSNTTSSPNVICVERRIYSKITVPESTGMRVAGTVLAGLGDSSLQNNYRRDAYFATTYTVAGAGAIERVDDNNPISEQIVG